MSWASHIRAAAKSHAAYWLTSVPNIHLWRIWQHCPRRYGHASDDSVAAYATLPEEARE